MNLQYSDLQTRSINPPNASEPSNESQNPSECSCKSKTQNHREMVEPVLFVDAPRLMFHAAAAVHRLLMSLLAKSFQRLSGFWEITGHPSPSR